MRYFSCTGIVWLFLLKIILLVDFKHTYKMQIIFLAGLYVDQYLEVLDDRDKLIFLSLQLSESNRIA